MQPQREADVEVFADYHQFYLWDAGADPVAPEKWTDQDVSNRAKVADHVLVVCPVRNTAVPVRVSLYSSQPTFDLSLYDHVVQATVALPTGQLQVHECTGREVLTWTVAPETYCALVLFAGLNTLSSNGREGDDRYHVALWPGQAVPLEVVKRWSEQ